MTSWFTMMLRRAIIEEGSKQDFKHCVLEYIPQYWKRWRKRIKRKKYNRRH